MEVNHRDNHKSFKQNLGNNAFFCYESSTVHKVPNWHPKNDQVWSVAKMTSLLVGKGRTVNALCTINSKTLSRRFLGPELRTNPLALGNFTITYSTSMSTELTVHHRYTRPTAWVSSGSLIHSCEGW